MKLTCIFAALIGMILPLQLAQAKDTESHQKVQSGKPKVIWHFASCRSHSPEMRTGFAEHGVLTTKLGYADRCENHNEPVAEIWYTSNPGYVGEDVVTIPIRGGRHPVFIYIYITVK